MVQLILFNFVKIGSLVTFASLRTHKRMKKAPEKPVVPFAELKNER